MDKFIYTLMVISSFGCGPNVTPTHTNINSENHIYFRYAEQALDNLKYGCIIKEVHCSMDDKVLYCVVSPYDPFTQSIKLDLLYKVYPNGFSPEVGQYYTITTGERYHLLLDNRIYIQRLEFEKVVADAN